VADLNTLSGDGSLATGRADLAELLDQHLPASVSVLWVFRNQRDRWCVRQEGGRTETFAVRDMALSFARRAGEVAGPHRLFLQGADGRFSQELVDCACGEEATSCACR
jgi:hypothetical protein